MAIVEFRPGDTLNIVWSSLQDTPLGRMDVESSFSYPYDELLRRLRSKGGKDGSRRSTSPGAKFSRVVALAAGALRNGKWSTGAHIERDDVFSKLMVRFDDLDESEYRNITKNAKRSLNGLLEDKGILKPSQRKELNSALLAIGSAVAKSENHHSRLTG